MGAAQLLVSDAPPRLSLQWARLLLQRRRQPPLGQPLAQFQTAQLALSPSGMSTRRGIAAASTTLVAPPCPRSGPSSQRSRQRMAQSTPTIARMAGPIGRRDGLLARKSGAAECTERVALVRV